MSPYQSTGMVLLAVGGLLAGCVSTDYTALPDDDEALLSRAPDVGEAVYRPAPAAPPVEPSPATDGVVELSLEQAVLLALRHNRDLHVRQFGPVVAGAFARIERGDYDPELFAEFEVNEATAREAARATGEQFDVEAEGHLATAGVRRRLPTGGAVEVAVEQERTASDRAPEQQEAAVRLSFTQSLLRGFGPTVNLAAIRQADLGVAASAYELRAFVETLLAETEIAYWRYVLAREEIAIFERSLEIAKRQRDEVEQRIEVGLLARTEAAAARAEVARREQALIDARGELRTRRLLLLRWTNPDPSGRLDLDVRASTGPGIEPVPVGDVDERLELARRRRSDLNEARLRFEQDRLEVVVTRNGLLPRLDFFTELRKTGFGGTFADSFDALGGDTYEVAAGFRLVHPLGNRASEGRDLAARATARQAAAALENLSQAVMLDVQLALGELDRARQQIDAGAVTRDLQERTWQAERERHEVGASTALLVAQALRDLLASQIAEIEAIVNYRIAIVNLYRAEGALLERRGIRLDAVAHP